MDGTQALKIAPGGTHPYQNGSCVTPRPIRFLQNDDHPFIDLNLDVLLEGLAFMMRNSSWALGEQFAATSRGSFAQQS